MKPSQIGFLAAIFVVLEFSAVPAETVLLRSGKAVEIIDGSLAAKGAEEVLREASEWLKKGRLDYAREYWTLLTEKGKGLPASRAKAAQEKFRNSEYTSFIILKDGSTLTGKIKAELRTDLLGLEGKKEVPIWALEEIVAEYHAGYSRVTKTFYPLTILEINFRGLGIKISRVTQELEFIVEAENGAASRAILGKSYEILRPEKLDSQLDSLTERRILKIVIYPNLAAQDW